MNLSKIKYWNRLRIGLNKWLLLLGVLSVIIVMVFYDNNDSLNFIIPSQRFTLTIYAIINFLIYLAVVNTFLLIIEMIDRTINFKERKILSHFFKWITMVLFLGIMLVQITLLIFNKVN